MTCEERMNSMLDGRTAVLCLMALSVGALGCQGEAIVAGNLASMAVAVALLLSTLRLQS
ncbi:MAG: hypothetical protein ABEL76_01105 [Bradymonadaceae bacterium]